MTDARASAVSQRPRQAVIRLLWEKQFEGSPWASKFHLIRPDSLEADYGTLADKIIAAIQPAGLAQSQDASEPVELIDKRLADLREANEIFRKSSWCRSSDIQRNDREIRWLIDLRTILLTGSKTPAAFECMGRKQALPEPGECNWPDCGCDPYATKVVESLLEQGWCDGTVSRQQEDILSLVRVWRECPEEKRPSVDALLDRIRAEIAKEAPELSKPTMSNEMLLGASVSAAVVSCCTRGRCDWSGWIDCTEPTTGRVNGGAQLCKTCGLIGTYQIGKLSICNAQPINPPILDDTATAAIQRVVDWETRSEANDIGAEPAQPFALTPLMLKLLKRAWKTTGVIILSDDMAFRHAENAAMRDLAAQGLVRSGDDTKKIPGPPRPTSWFITDAGKAALSSTVREGTD
ncbi:hypothetical protein J6524_05025 [Bradyrhizobium sp. WSM 1738]|uniref:hypothetical protein n=1 Tax=Bradyrhizobium hereditatis TaxID=2821405 RepID=UPI001CE2FAFA|nr:hypothetical protein [Bradyrhizobium hereditatis]MCA6114292.1 hypothetical protein [Bradyrhizobium hereditatis]